MKARFDTKQPPVKIVENNDEAYVFICLNEEEKEEVITYTIYPDESGESEDINDNVDPGFSVDLDIDINTEDDTNIEVENESEIKIDVNESEESEMVTTTSTLIYYEYDYNEFHDKKENLDLDDIQANPEKYLIYSISKENEQGNLKEDFNSLKTQFEELQNAIERGLNI